MELIDSHCHLNSFQDFPLIIQRAEDAGVTHIATIGTCLNDFSILQTIAQKYPGYISMTVGIHPDEAEKLIPEMVQDYYQYIPWDQVIGIGEIGLDYRNELTPDMKKRQQDLFVQQLEWAMQTDLPVVIHSRNAVDDTWSIMRQFPKLKGGVMHCFCEDVHWAKTFLDFGFYISFSGIVTFKNAKTVQETAAYVPLDRMLVETDSPFLAPAPYRGKENEPAFVKIVAQFLAELRHEKFDHLANTTSQSFNKLFLNK